ncbi:hypothetical protein AO366_0428 [Moraxella catarrhalis]|nr:hypothetical protein AO381_1078 [Moraxella catarrhalis]OAV19852.1 hypothetical protein AO372_1822 [Moraxella catarrhalis]OAV35002.1 hypothetical protein AO366_0428 [Moraxella catarrhalis]
MDFDGFKINCHHHTILALKSCQIQFGQCHNILVNILLKF